jgi:anti-sigma factor ChrR (cupin superfamily)
MTFLPSCHEVQSELTEYAEGALPLARRVTIWIHLCFCQVCAGFMRGLRALPALAKRSLAPPEATPETATRTLAEVLAVLSKPPDR